ncbi:1-phosphatidylinositol-4,5-bisphosphate phosphodiesterase beta-2 [Gossypium australe]|uniref:1-phosphatidylinositol-4,5-bisphosphate phosphodiesterase beta-2 n=1 Tax=Gossypium australe TaxID=47621 RepID=A0A5B6VV05_9ROSI|nr:1-phosphatidylinositol-4,5-bisphosphate phosphodiesterase beta-2 [Gossypium australe]
MNDLDCILEQKLKGAVSLLYDEAYQWWLTVEEGTQLDRASYVDGRRCEFMNLTQEDRSVAEYKAEFLRLSRYARGMVASEYERCFDLRTREREFAVLVENAKITEDVKLVRRQNRDRERGKNKRDSEPSSSVQRPKKKARFDGPIRVGAPVVPTGI